MRILDSEDNRGGFPSCGEDRETSHHLLLHCYRPWHLYCIICFKLNLARVVPKSLEELKLSMKDLNVQSNYLELHFLFHVLVPMAG